MSSTGDQSKFPRITLVGAGPGDPDMITLKGLKALEEADVVLYDALVSVPLLDRIPKDVPAWSVGKRAGAHSFRQEEINTLLVEFALQYGHVVRLKGGDPFVFGRGQEEIEFAQSKGISVSVVPGISSAYAVPASAGIPLTRRNVSESFWVVTGTTRLGEISPDISLAAQSTATVVILMGMNHIESIADLFIRHGKANVPVAVIQNGTLESQRMVAAPVSGIVRAVQQSGLGSPAVIVIGEVVRYADGAGVREWLVSQGISLAY